jgi:hypothetical protein
MHYMTWYTDTYGITTMSLLYRPCDMVKCMCYMGLGFNGCFMADAELTDCHYKTKVRLNRTASVIYGSVQYLRHRCCITGPSR